MKRKLVPLATRMRREHPHLLPDLERLVVERRVLVAGAPVLNVHALVDAHAHLDIVEERELRGTVKLRHALDALAIDVAGRACLDVGASSGGFTVALLERGARRVYAVDAGAGQLLGRLRLDARVVNLERTNLAALDATLVPEPIDVVTVDLSYLSLATALPQVARVPLAPRADLVLLVKPMFELGRATAPTVHDQDDEAREHALDDAVAKACIAAEAAGARVVSTMRSRVTGARGAIELFVHART